MAEGALAPALTEGAGLEALLLEEGAAAGTAGDEVEGTGLVRRLLR